MSRVDSEPKPLGEGIREDVHPLRPLIDTIRRIFPHRRTKHEIRIIAFDPYRTLGPHPQATVELPRKPKG